MSYYIYSRQLCSIIKSHQLSHDRKRSRGKLLYVTTNGSCHNAKYLTYTHRIVCHMALIVNSVRVVYTTNW